MGGGGSMTLGGSMYHRYHPVPQKGMDGGEMHSITGLDNLPGLARPWALTASSSTGVPVSPQFIFSFTFIF